MDTHNAISSPASAAGASPCGSPDGPTIEKCGQAQSPASPSATPGADKASGTPATFGPLFNASSPSAALQRSLENRLRARLDVNGSPEYVLTWKHWDMPSGPSICRLRASARRISDSASGGWPTPMAGAPGTENYNPAGNTDSSRKTVDLLDGWPTPAKQNAEGGARKEGESRGWNTLQTVAKLAGWPTCSARDWKGCKSNQHGKNPRPLNEVAYLASGPASTSFPAPTGKRGALNPAHSRWLMGFPVAWDCCGAMAMQSCRKSRRSSSKRRSNTQEKP